MEQETKFVLLKDVPKYIPGITAYRIRQLCKQGKIRYNMAGNRYIINIVWLLEDLEKIAIQNQLANDTSGISYGRLRKIETK